MNINTGEIRDFSEILESEKANFVPLTDEQANRYRNEPPQKRVIMYQNEQRHLEKQITKRRAANKRNKQSRKN